jgi:hypothetical protein
MAVPGQRTKNHILGVPPGYPMPRDPVWYWPVWLGVVVAGLAVAGLVVVWRPSAVRPAAAAAGVLGAQIAGRGIVGVRDLFNVNGAGDIDMSQSELATLVTVAAAVAMAGAVAACLAVGLLWREPASGWSAWRPRRPGLIVTGAVVALLVPLPVLVRGGGHALTSAGGLALAGPLPWGLALFAAAWLGPRVRRATVRTVFASAAVVVLNVGVSMVVSMV